MKRIQFLLGVCLVMVPLTASAQVNTTAANASPYKPGQGWITVNIDAANLERWYGYDVVAGRSYCVEGVSESAPTMASYDGDTMIFRGDGTTPIGANDDYVTETSGGGGFHTNPGRVCYISDEDGSHLARLSNFGLSTTTTSYRWRVEDTTLFCPWFFSGGGFESFILIRNTTASQIKATVRLRNAAGSVVGPPQTATVPANGSFNLQVSAAPPKGFGLASANGTVEIAYGSTQPFGAGSFPNWAQGAPGSVVANVTSLSFGQGVSFDTPASPRQDWRN